MMHLAREVMLKTSTKAPVAVLRPTLVFGSTDTHSFAELERKGAALFDRPIEIVTTPRQNPITHRHFDVGALRRAFPAFRFTPLEDGLARAQDECREGG